MIIVPVLQIRTKKMIRLTPPRNRPGHTSLQRSQENFDWKNICRDIVDMAKIGIRNYSTVLGNIARTTGNAFILPIFTQTYNPAIQLFEIVRRGTHPVLMSLKTSTNLLENNEQIRDSVENIVNTFCTNIALLYKFGSHTDLRPDEIDFLEKRGIHQGLNCQCGQCRLNRLWVRPSRVRRTLIYPHTPVHPRSPIFRTPIFAPPRRLADQIFLLHQILSKLSFKKWNISPSRDEVLS